MEIYIPREALRAVRRHLRTQMQDIERTIVARWQHYEECETLLHEAVTELRADVREFGPQSERARETARWVQQATRDFEVAREIMQNLVERFREVMSAMDLCLSMDAIAIQARTLALPVARDAL